MPESVDWRSIAKVVFSDDDEHDNGDSTQDVWGGKFDCCSSFYGDSEVSIFIQACGRFTVPITKEAVECLLSTSDNLSFMKLMMPHEELNECGPAFIYGERVKFISNKYSQEPVIPKIVSYICKCVLGTDDSKVVNEFLKLHLDKVLLIKEADNNSSIVLNESEAYPGICSTVLLLVPTKEGFTGGGIKVMTHQRGFQRFEFEKESNKDFAIILFPAESRYEIEPINAGSVFIAVFHLIWTDSFVANSASPSLSKTIKLYQNLKNLLSTWEQSQQLTTYDLIAKQENPPENDAECLTIAVGDPAPENIENANGCRMACDGKIQKNDITGSRDFSIDKHETEAKNLVFLLTERYSTSNIISFSQLIGHDQLLAHVLRSVDFIDAHLAIVFLSAPCDNSAESATFAGVYQWAGFEDSFPQSPSCGPWGSSQLIGTPQHCLFKSSDTKGDLLAHYAIVIQPRKQSIVFSCLHNIDRVLDCLEHRLWPLLRLSRSRRSNKWNLLKHDLMEVIRFCSNEPETAFLGSTPKVEKRSARLLKLSLNLRAHEETLALLQLLGTDFSIDQEDANSNSSKIVLFYEGLRTEESSKIVTDLEYRVVEWKDSGTLILRLVSPLRIFRQLNCFIKLVHHFLDRNRFQAGRQVANRIAEIFSKLSINQANYMSPDQHKYYASFVFSLEMKTETSDEERLEHYFVLFRKLEFSVQSQILTHLKDFDKTISTAKLFEEMVEAALFESFSAECFAPSGLPIIEIVLCSSNEAPQQRLVSRIGDEKNTALKCGLADGILKFLHHADFTTYSEQGLVALSQLMEIGVDKLKSKATNLYGDGSNHMYDYDSEFRIELHSFVRLVMFLENDDRTANLSLTTLAGNVLYDLPLTCLCQLLQDLRTSDGEELRKHPKSYNLYFEICQMTGLRRREFIGKLPAVTVVGLIECFIWLDDMHLASGLVHQIDFEEPDKKWSEPDVITLLSSMASNTVLWQLLVPSSSQFVCRTVNTLLRAWLASLDSRLKYFADENSPFEQLRSHVLGEAKVCLSLYVQNSLKFPDDANAHAEVIPSLMALFSPLEVCEIVVHVGEANKRYWKFYKQNEAARLQTYVDICMSLSAFELNDLVQSCNETFFDTLKCVFRIGNEDILLTLVRKITSALPEDQENSFVIKILTSPFIHQLAQKSASAQRGFLLFIEHRINWLKALIIRELKEDQPDEFDESNECQEAAQELGKLEALVEELRVPCKGMMMRML